MASASDKPTAPIGPEGWRPEEGDSVTGVVKDLDLGWSDYQNASYPIVTLELDNGGEIAVHAFHAVLQSRLKSARPKPGDRLTITFHGKRETRDGKRTVAVYSVEAPDRVVDPEAFWGPAAAIEGRQAAPATSEEDIPF